MGGRLTSKDLKAAGIKVADAPAMAERTTGGGRLSAAFAARRANREGMNATERAYAAHLDIRIAAGEVAWWAFESVTFKLAHDTRLTPDFLVQMASGELEVHEVKGRKGDSYRCEDDAKVKLKCAAAKFPLRILIVFPRPKGTEGWEIIEVPHE